MQFLILASTTYIFSTTTHTTCKRGNILVYQRIKGLFIIQVITHEIIDSLSKLVEISLYSATNRFSHKFWSLTSWLMNPKTRVHCAILRRYFLQLMSAWRKEKTCKNLCVNLSYRQTDKYVKATTCTLYECINSVFCGWA